MNDRQRVHEQIDRDRLRRHSNRVLHGHPSPTLWDEPDVPVDEILKWGRHRAAITNSSSTCSGTDG